MAQYKIKKLQEYDVTKYCTKTDAKITDNVRIFDDQKSILLNRSMQLINIEIHCIQ